MQSLLNHPQPVDCRRLLVCNHGVWLNIGVGAAEQRGEQRVVIDTGRCVPLALSTPREDPLHEGVDDDDMRRTVAARVAEGHTPLHETPCDDRLQRLLAQPQVRAARLSTPKPEVHPDGEPVGREVFAIKELP